MKLEFIAINTKVPPAIRAITSLIQQNLKGIANGPTKELLCVNVTEIAADKWVAFTRRAATAARGYRNHDHTLIRHLYDLYMLDQQHALDKTFQQLAIEIISDDIQQYKAHSVDYVNDPIQKIRYILNKLSRQPIWREDWENFINSMVFQGNAPDFSNVLKTLDRVSDEVIQAYEKKFIIQ